MSPAEAEIGQIGYDPKWLCDDAVNEKGLSLDRKDVGRWDACI